MKGSTQTTIRAHINIFLGSVALLFAATATAGVILKIDIANPDVIEFIATEVSSQIDNNTYVYAEGVTLLGFFGTSAPGIEAGMSGTLAVPHEDFNLYYDEIFSESNDLELFVAVDEDDADDPATVEIQEFTQSSRAFSGTSTLTGSDSIDRMKGVGSTGDIVAGYAKSDNGVSDPIGQWEIIDSSNVEQDFDVDGLSYTTVGMPDGEVQVTGRASDNTATDIVIPATVVDSGTAYSVTTIGDRAFYGNALTSVTIGNSVTTIEDVAFFDNALTSVTIGNSVTSIGKEAFAFNALTSVIIPDSVISIMLGAFGNNAITTLTIGNSVTTIEDLAFANNALTSVIIPDSVTTIGVEAFNDNELTSAAFKGGFGDFLLNMFDTNPTLATITYCEGTSGWPQGFNNGSTTIVTTEMPCSTAVDPALIWLLLRPQVLDEE